MQIKLTLLGTSTTAKNTKKRVAKVDERKHEGLRDIVPVEISGVIELNGSHHTDVTQLSSLLAKWQCSPCFKYACCFDGWLLFGATARSLISVPHSFTAALSLTHRYAARLPCRGKNQYPQKDEITNVLMHRAVSSLTRSIPFTVQQSQYLPHRAHFVR